MLLARAFLALISMSAVGATQLNAVEDSPGDGREVENLAAFARAYGYVRFFHPSDEASAVDWDKVGILGAETVRNASDSAALRAALLRVFEPIAPSLRLSAETALPSSAGTAVSSTAGKRLIFWQYQGIKLTEQSGPYRQQRVVTGGLLGNQNSLFQPATAPSNLTKTIAPGLVLELPLALPVGLDGKTAGGPSPEFQALQTQLARIDLKAITPADWRLRVAGVMTVWNIFQHFHPYLDGIGVKWEDALRPALRRALRDRNADDYYATLCELVAKSRDGHGYVYGRPAGTAGIPIRVDVIEQRLVVTGATDGSPFRKGDIIERVDGELALDLLHEDERYVSGSPQLRRFRALNRFGEGPTGSLAHIELSRDGAAATVDLARTQDRHGLYFFNSISEFSLPAISEVRPGIFYVNLESLDGQAFESKLPQLAAARGVIFDWRPGGPFPAGNGLHALQPHADIIPHLIDKTIQASPMLVPQISAPDRAGWTCLESTWPVRPKEPRFKGRIVFIDEPSVVSYGETCTAMIADYHLATLVGSTTAGCNGNANFIPLSGGFRVMWTGMDVRKHDHSPFYTIGFVPDYPVARTIRAVKEGRDEYLEKAIEVIERSPQT